MAQVEIAVSVICLTLPVVTLRYTLLIGLQR